MASIRFNQIADARGSINGTVYSRGIGGLYMKNRVKPLNPQSSKQTAVRSQLSQLASSWRELSDAERKAWSEMAPNYPTTNRVGESYIPSGYQLYMTLNSSLNSAGQINLSVPVNPGSFVEAVLSSAVLQLTAGVLTTGTLQTDDDIPAGEFPVIEATGSLSQGVSSPSSSLFKKIEVGANDTGTWDIISSYVAVFGQPVVGSKVYFKITRVLGSTGQRQLLGVISATVTTL